MKLLLQILFNVVRFYWGPKAELKVRRYVARYSYDERHGEFDREEAEHQDYEVQYLHNHRKPARYYGLAVES